MCKLMKDLGWAANQAVPLVGVRTPDQPAALRAIVTGFHKAGWGVVTWDAKAGLRAGNRQSPEDNAAVSAICADENSPPPAALEAADAVSEAMPARCVVLICNAQRVLDARMAQALLNVRDPYKQTNRMVILLGPSFELPPELGGDVHLIDQALPGADERIALVNDVAQSANFEVSNDQRIVLAESLRGVSLYAAEQILTLGATIGQGYNLAKVRSYQREVINSNPGLSVDNSGATLDDVAGLANYKKFANAVANGKNRPNKIIRLEEVEKALGGSSGGDSSGVSQNLLGAILTWMEEKRVRGLIALGPPGSGKSLCSVATGAACQADTITLDLGGMKASLVGQSEQNIRNALRVLDSVAENTFWIATCNNLAAVPPELRRRFKAGVWFFDLPTAEEREALWTMYLARYEVPDVRPLNDNGWSGAEIRNCCESASDLSITPREAAEWIVPAATSASEQIEALRRGASGKYVSASNGGPYMYPGPCSTTIEAPSGRALGGFAA